MPFPADCGAGKCTFAPFLQETGRKICGKSEKDRIYIRDNSRLKNHSRRQSGMHFGYVTENGVNSNDIRNPLRYLFMNAVTSRPAFKSQIFR